MPSKVVMEIYGQAREEVIRGLLVSIQKVINTFYGPTIIKHNGIWQTRTAKRWFSTTHWIKPIVGIDELQLRIGGTLKVHVYGFIALDLINDLVRKFADEYQLADPVVISDDEYRWVPA